MREPDLCGGDIGFANVDPTRMEHVFLKEANGRSLAATKIYKPLPVTSQTEIGLQDPSIEAEDGMININGVIAPLPVGSVLVQVAQTFVLLGTGRSAPLTGCRPQ